MLVLAVANKIKRLSFLRWLVEVLVLENTGVNGFDSRRGSLQVTILRCLLEKVAGLAVLLLRIRDIHATAVGIPRIQKPVFADFSTSLLQLLTLQRLAPLVFACLFLLCTSSINTTSS